MTKQCSPRRGFTLRETLGLAVMLVAVVGTLMPLMGGIRGRSRVFISLANLEDIGVATAQYAADWNGRQPTYVVDDLASYGDDLRQAFNSYNSGAGVFDGAEHPGVTTGWGIIEGSGNCILYRYYTSGNSANAGLTTPIIFTEDGGGIPYFGSFRLPNATALRRGYLENKFYAPVFYAPDDALAYDAVSPVFDMDIEYKTDLLEDSDAGMTYGDLPVWSSYCTSPAAMFDPGVMRHPDDGGYQDPYAYDDGLRSPALDQALYPDLKTYMLEHNWNQAPPLQCNPAFAPGTYGSCEPYYFNHGRASMPATLFYDLSARVLPNKEVYLSDQQVLGQTGSGLWSRDTPWGVDGYFSDLSFDDLTLSHHILTTDGIRGRDTTR